MWKKSLFLLLALLGIFSVLSFTLANPNYSIRSRNIITTGKVNITIQEASPAGDGYISGVDKQDGTGIEFSNITPGMIASKIVNIKNTDEACWLRVAVQTRVTLADGSIAEKGPQMISMNIDRSADSCWKYQDGYYYYKDPLQKDDVTQQPLFTEVQFAPQMGNEYAGCVVEVKVSAEAIQYKNNEVSDVTLAWHDGGGV